VRARRSEFARGHVVLRMVDGFYCKQFPALEIADAEAARGRIAPQHLPVVILRESDDEQLAVELIGPEPGHAIMRDRLIRRLSAAVFACSKALSTESRRTRRPKRSDG